MTDNEIIARFDGATQFKTKDGTIYGYWPEHNGWIEVSDYADECEIVRWHGPGGLLEKIEEKGLAGDFYDLLSVITSPTVRANSIQSATTIGWNNIASTTAQLTAALVATIKEVSDD